MTFESYPNDEAPVLFDSAGYPPVRPGVTLLGWSAGEGFTFKCPHCFRTFPTRYPRKKKGGHNPLADASARNNFKSHVAACKRKENP